MGPGPHAGLPAGHGFRDLCQHEEAYPAPQIDSGRVDPGHAQWNLHLPQGPRLRMVPERHRRRAEYLVELAQCDRLDEEPPVHVTKGVAVLYRDRDPGATLLGAGDLCQLCLFQQLQQDLSDHAAARAYFPVRLPPLGPPGGHRMTDQ